MTSIPDLTESEQHIVQTTADERWGKGVAGLQLADVEIQLNHDSEALTACPALFWVVNDCSFVIIKTGEQGFRCNFFYKNDLEQMSTGVEKYDNIGDCVIELLRVQADYDSLRSGAFPGK